MSKKKQTREKNASIEDIYRNKHFVPPKEKNLETIFEEPRKSKDGAPILTSVKKYKRYLHFDPTQNKINKRKLKAKKCFTKRCFRNTRSSPKSSKNVDISMYILEALGDASDDSDMDISNNNLDKTVLAPDLGQSTALESPSSSARDLLSSDSCDTPKRKFDNIRSIKLQKIESDPVEATEDILNDNSEEVTVTRAYEDDQNANMRSNDVEEKLESPRRSPEKLMEILAH